MEEKEKLIRLIQESNSLSDVLRKQNKSVSGVSIRLLKDKLDALGISYAFVPIKDTRLLDLDDIMKENRPYSSCKLKKRLFACGLKEEKCEICGQTAEWNGKHLELQLDHINGDHNDNRLENLRILCPNCHSQTSTFGNKRKKHNYCIDCGKEISPKSIRCNKCAVVSRIRYKVKPEDRPTKELLQSLIMTKNFVEVGKMYGVTDNTVRKWCKKYELPSTKNEIKNFNMKK